MSRMTSRSTVTGRRRIDELTSEIKSIANSTFLELTKQSPQFGELPQADTQSFFTSAFNTTKSVDSDNHMAIDKPSISPKSQRNFEFPQSQSTSVMNTSEQLITLANLNSSPKGPMPQENGRKTPVSKSMVLQENEPTTTTRSSFVGSRGLTDSLSKLHAKVDGIISRSPAQFKKTAAYKDSSSKENVAPTPSFNFAANNQSFQGDAQDSATFSRITPQKSGSESLKLNLKVHSLPPFHSNTYQDENGKKIGSQIQEHSFQRSPMGSLQTTDTNQENYKSQKIPSTMSANHILYNSAVLPGSSPKKQPYDKAKLDRIVQNISRRKDSQTFSSSNIDNSSISNLNSKSTVELGRSRPDFETRGKLL